MLISSLTLLCLGTFLAGTYQAFVQFYRFAAAEVTSDAFKPRAISPVLAGGVVAALVGPLLASVHGDLLQPAYPASFLSLALASALAVGVLRASNARQNSSFQPLPRLALPLLRCRSSPSKPGCSKAA